MFFCQHTPSAQQTLAFSTFTEVLLKFCLHQNASCIYCMTRVFFLYGVLFVIYVCLFFLNKYMLICTWILFHEDISVSQKYPAMNGKPELPNLQNLTCIHLFCSGSGYRGSILAEWVQPQSAWGRYSYGTESPVMSFVCNTNNTANENIEKVLYLLLNRW